MLKNKIIECLENANFTLTDAARALSISRTTLSNIVHGKCSLTPRIAQRFEHVFGLPAESLLKQDKQRKQEPTPAQPAISLCRSSIYFSITSTNIEQWSETRGSRSTLAQLVRILILSTTAGITSIDFPALDDAERKGFDGKMQCESLHPWVPKGDSYWEMGTSNDYQAKANHDIDKATADLSLTTQKRQQSIFVFVTPRKWDKKEEWCAQKRKLYDWKDIRVLDASSLEQWMECSLQAQTWFMHQQKCPTHGIDSLSNLWEEWRTVTRPTLPDALFDELIAEFNQSLTSFLEGPKKHFSISADSEEEAYAFLHLALKDRDIAHQCLVFRSDESLEAIPRYPNSIIAITSSAHIKKALIGREFQRCIWINTTIAQPSDIKLHPISRDGFIKAWETNGVGRTISIQWEQASAGSLTALRRWLCKFKDCLFPEWSNGPQSSLAIPFMFAGAWEAPPVDNDMETLAELAENGTNLSKDLQEVMSWKNSPLWKEAQSLGVKSKRDLFLILKSKISADAYERFFKTIIHVLTTPPVTNANRSFITAQEQSTSELLRRNLADTLVLLARSSEYIQQDCYFDCQKAASDAVKRILEAWDIDYFRVYDDTLECLALAASNEFLEYFEKHRPICTALMAPVDNIFLASTPRCAFISALHALCWEETTFKRATKLLASLISIEPKDCIGNNPTPTLQEIFCAWYPQTAVPAHVRANTLKELVKEFNNDLWTICLSELTSLSHPVVCRTPPIGIRIGGYTGGRASANDEQAMRLAKEDLLFSSMFSLTTQHIDQLFNAYENLSDEHRKTLLSIAEDWQKSASGPEKENLAHHLESRLRYAWSKADCYIPKAEIDRIKTICTLLAPKTTGDKVLYLFSSRALHDLCLKTPEEKNPLDLLDKKRVATVAEIYKTKGLDGLLRLCEQVDVNEIRSVAGCIARTQPYTRLVKLIIKARECITLQKRLKELLFGLLYTPNVNILNALARRLQSDELYQLILDIPMGQALSIFVSSQFPTREAEYWKAVRIGNQLARTTDDAIVVAEKLLSHDRANAAFAYTWPQFKSIPATLIHRIMKNMKFEEEEQTLVSNFSSYEIGQAMNLISENPDIPLHEKAFLEIKFSDILRPTGMAEEFPLRNLVDYIMQQPKFLVELLNGVAFKDDQGNEKSTDEFNAKIVRTLYHIINVLNFDDQTGIDSIDYQWWMRQLLQFAEEKHMRKFTEYTVGEVLGRHNRKRFDSDDHQETVWFYPAYCELIQNVGTEEIQKGLYFGLTNSIGAHFYSANGDTDRKIAAIFARDAELTKDYPKVQAVFKSLQANFENYGRNEDQQCKKRQRTRAICW